MSVPYNCVQSLQCVVVLIKHHQNLVSGIQKIQLHKMSSYIIKRLMALAVVIWEDWDGKILEMFIILSISYWVTCYLLLISSSSLYILDTTPFKFLFPVSGLFFNFMVIF